MAVQSIKDVLFFQVEETGRYFLCDQRFAHEHGRSWTSNQLDGTPYMLIHSGSTKPLDAVLEHAGWFLDRWVQKPEHMFIVEARNKTQVKEFLLDMHHIVEYGGKLIWPDRSHFLPAPVCKCTPVSRYPHPVEVSLQDLMATSNNPSRTQERNMDKQTLKNREKMKIKAAKKRIKIIDSIPDEPLPIDGPCIIQFQKRFHRNGQVYDYAAIRTDQGLWYTTGPQSPKGYEWTQLITWIFNGDFASDWATIDGIWIASEFVPIP